MKLIGVATVNYTSKKTGNPVNGYEFYLSYPKKSCIAGVACTKQYVSASVVEERNGGSVPPIDSEIEFEYNRYGNITNYFIVEK